MQWPIDRACLYNVAAVETVADGSLRLCRVAAAVLPHLSPKGVERAHSTAGVELRFRLRAQSVRVALRTMPDSNPIFDSPAAVLAGVFYGDFQHNWYALQPTGTTLTIAPPPFPEELATHRRRFDPRLVRVVLPLFPETRIVSMEGEWDPPAPGDAPARRYLAYGSSITHGAHTPMATATYPAIIGQAFDADVLNLGLGGAARLEPEMADWLAARDDWHAASLELGINVFGELDPTAFRSRVRRCLAPFAADPRQRPVACLDLLPFREELSGKATAKAAAFRRLVAEETAALCLPRIRHIPYAPSLGRITGLCADLLHPAAHGFTALGRSLAERLCAFPEFARALAPDRG